MPVFLRCAEELRRSPRTSHSTPKVESSKGKLQVALLTKKPSAAAQKKALALASDEDLLAIEGRELYWLPERRHLESELDLKAIAPLLGADTTPHDGHDRADRRQVLG